MIEVPYVSLPSPGLWSPSVGPIPCGHPGGGAAFVEGYRWRARCRRTKLSARAMRLPRSVDVAEERSMTDDCGAAKAPPRRHLAPWARCPETPWLILSHGQVSRRGRSTRGRRASTAGSTSTSRSKTMCVPLPRERKRLIDCMGTARDANPQLLASS